VISNNDEMAMGALQAMKAAGVDTSKVIIGGVDATQEALASMQAGDLKVTVFQDAAGQGKGALDTALTLAKGGKVDKVVSVPFKLVTPDNVKDFLTKNYAEGGAWQIESKFKGPDRKIFVNPHANSKGINVDVEYGIKEYGIKTKTNITDKLGVKPTVTYEQGAHKVEFTTDRSWKHELKYEGKVGPATLLETLTATDATASVAVLVAPGISVGGAATYSLGASEIKSWEAGALYSANNITADVYTIALKKYVAGVKFPFAVAGQAVTVGAQVDHSEKGSVVTVGVETKCVLCDCAKIRAKVRSTGAFAVSYIAKLSDNWTASVTFDSEASSTLGLWLTRE